MTLDVASGVSIPVQFRTPTTKRYVTATSHPQLSRQKVVKIAKKSEGVKYLTTSVRTVSVGRSLKYPTETNFLLDKVKKGLESGKSISRNEIYLRLIQQFGNDGILGPPSEFCSVMKPNGGGISPALAQWKIRTKLDGCTVLINADEVFIKFFPRDTEFVVSQTIPPGGKYKVDRVQVIQWVEEAVSMVNEKQNSDRKIEYMFKRLGQDPRQPSNQAFQEHIGHLQENELYNSLLLNQTAENLV
ncbi:hypothetical protein GN244_ATG08537 [Phytophthora infestans]|uniref:Uncharacterized protein n=1 Tax=Phytophthora infestans TaxID=4787 RepID=A0A833WVM9_PHYIN|nr:hypothetical protein GN244_ATG08537 [Phytophthora infestans]